MSGNSRRDALLGRVGRGIEHRLNNVATLLLLGADGLAGASPSSDRDAEGLEDILERCAHDLGIVGDMLSPANDKANVVRIVQATASIMSGMHHAITVSTSGSAKTLPCDVERLDLAHLLLAITLALHTALDERGDIVLQAQPLAPSAIEVQIRARSPDSVRPLSTCASGDHDLAREIADQSGIAMDVRETQDEITATLTISSS